MAIEQLSNRWSWLFLTSLLVSLLGNQPACVGQSPISALAFSLDNQWVIAGSQRGFEVRDWPSLDVSRSMNCELDSIHDLSMSPDGKHLLVGGGSPGTSGVVQLRSWPELELEHAWSEHRDVVYKVAWRADGAEWVSVSWDGYCRVCRRDAEASHITMTSHSGPVFAGTYLSDGSIASAGSDRSIVVWNPSSGESSKVLRQHTEAVHALVLQPAREGGPDRLLASASEDRTVRFWQPNIGRMVRFHRFNSTPRSIAWTQDGRWLMVGCDDGSLVQLDPISLKNTVLSQQEASVLNLLTEPKNIRLCVSVGHETILIEPRRAAD